MAVVTTKILKESKLKNEKEENVSALFWDGEKWVDFPVEFYDGTSYTILNEGRYQTTWFASWSQSYRYLNLTESNSKHGSKYVREDETHCGYQRGEQFAFQGWWSKDPNGRGASLIGFDTESIKSTLKNTNIERVELYLRNLHECQTSTDASNNTVPIKKVQVWKHNRDSKPASIKVSNYFSNTNKKVFSAYYHRGPSLQRDDSVYKSAGRRILPNWETGWGTGLLDWTRLGNSEYTTEGSGNNKKVWKVLNNSIVSEFLNGTTKGFALYDSTSNSLGEGYGYWGGATITPAIYLAISKQNHMQGFNKEVSFAPQLRITYTKLNP